MDFLPAYLADLDRIFDALVILSINGSIIVAVVFLLQRFFHRSLSPKWIYAIWMLVIVRFVLVIAPASPVSFQNWIASKHFDQVSNDEPATSNFKTAGQWTISSRPESGVVAESKTLEPTVPDFSISGLITIVWAVVFLILLCRFVKSILLTQGIVRTAQPASETIRNIFDEAKCWTESGDNVEILITNQLDTPAACGLLRPNVLLPDWCVDQLNDDELRLVFVHELTHLKRKTFGSNQSHIWFQ